MTFVPGERNVDEFKITKDQGFFGATKPVIVRIPGTTAATAGNYTAPFFIADRGYRVLKVTERHEAIGGAPGDAAVDVLKVPSGTAPASGTSVLSGTIPLTTTANTVQTGTLSTAYNALNLIAGDSLSLKSSGTLTTVEGVTVAVTLRSI